MPKKLYFIQKKIDNGSKNRAREEVFNIGEREPGHRRQRRKKIQEKQADCIVRAWHVFHESGHHHECLPAKPTA